MGFKIIKLYHPSHRVPSLEAADEFFQRVFGIPSVWRSSLFSKPDPRYPTYPTDYCIFTSIADVFFDCIDPQKYVIDGEQRYATVDKPHLHGFGWGVEGMDEIYAKIQTIGVKCTDQANRPSDPKECPVASFKVSKLFYTDATTSGVRYEFYPVESIGVYDHRQDPSWELKPQEGKGALKVQYCSHHTVLTTNKARAKEIYVDTLGGKIIHEGRNKVRGTESLYIQLADAVYEFATPIDDTSYAARDYQQREHPSEDVYHALTWKVENISLVKAHLKSTGVRVIAEDDQMVVIDADDGIGIPWGFTACVLPHDDRYSVNS
ncbi:hypothetical protein LTR10_023915 [Elasticomyces elasticus]|uniref:VOC domain-containing protein n=1 Tax=Exophiala sideris TaxID=1016849 RepID=A0ABR0IVS6_9EURO|nr:hypothetical protein LTR10_023915 [Elasticomyces elasticus]KAK5020874.1 hypothetical protein LTS07_011376 [Exophiala sideris]KAK5022999.1 hypothetical protein LTR13_011345 [Exophiala sideris]KAK5048413.1 hypothetical protein LTR69_011401 [Exophiala sideris]KAK5176080.1 hypothetical protein LTR44_011355 [Eurotiomycetes sp. CCFEE 6388]